MTRDIKQLYNNANTYYIFQNKIPEVSSLTEIKYCMLLLTTGSKKLHSLINFLIISSYIAH